MRRSASSSLRGASSTRKSSAGSWTTPAAPPRWIFAATLTSVSPSDSLNLATVDLQLPGGQITVQGFFYGTQSRIVHAITGGTGTYRDAAGEFSFTFSSPGVLDMTLTILE